MGFASFDISSLSGVSINRAILDLGPISELGDVSFFNKFYITSIYWGAKKITNVSISILEGEGSVIGQVDNPSGYEDSAVWSDTPDLIKEIQKAINEGKPRFQIRIHFSGPITDNDGEFDIWSFKRENISLKVFYDN